ncbi:MAG: hypothetical protein J6J60_06805 [Clostridia bacterium]|nr:hypothetical protein [Clostridia bacterium]
MVKELNHKIFNLIIMICVGICLISISSISYAQETNVIYGEDIEADYVPAERDDKSITESKADTMWERQNNNTLFQEVRRNVAQWYYVFRYLSIAVMLVILIVVGIKLALSSIAEEKAVYKRMLVDWLVCFILVFMVHYFMIFTQFLNERLIYIFQNVSNNINGDIEYGLYETVRSRAYDSKITIGFTGMVLYMMLVWFNGKYILIYAKRFILMVILTIMAPIIVLFYGIQKIFTGRSNTLVKWMGEYFTNTIMQAIHAMTYVVFVGMALKLSQTSLVGIILAFICLNFMSKADTMFRQIFKFFDGSTVAEDIAQSKLADFKDDVMTGVTAGAVAAQLRNTTKNTIGYNDAIWRETFESKKLGKKLISVNDAIQAFPGNTSLLLASKVTRGFNKRGYEKRTLKREAKNQEFNDKIDSYEANIAKIRAKLNPKNTTISNDQKVKFQNQLNQLYIERNQLIHEQGNYNTKAGIYERLRVLLDPDTYLEYVFDDDTGDFVYNKNNKKKMRMARKRILYDAETNSYKKQGGVKERFKSAKDAVLNLSEDDKKVLNELTQVVKNGTIGAGAMMLGVGAFADNPALGFALLASGAGKTKNFVKVNNNGLKISRYKRRKIAKYYLNQMEKTRYTDAVFTSNTILNMDKSIRQLTNLDPTVAHFHRLQAQMESGDLKFAVPMTFFKLTGTNGGIRNILVKSTNVVKQHETNIKRYEISVNVEYAKALTKEILEQAGTVCGNITNYMMKKNSVRMLIEKQLKNGSIFVANGKLFGFDDPLTRGNLTREDKIKQAIMQTALKKNIYNFDKFDLNNKYLRNELLKQLKECEVVMDKDISRDSLIQELFNGTNGVIGVTTVLKDLSKNSPDLLKTKLFQSCVEEYAKMNQSTSIDDLLSKAARKSIMTSFRNKYFYDPIGTQVQAGILELAAKSNTKILDLSTTDIKNMFKTSNPSMLAALENRVKAKSRTVDKEIEIKQKQIDAMISDMVLSVLVKNNIANPNSIDFTVLNDATTQTIKGQLLDMFNFTYKDAKDLELPDEVVLQIMQDKIDSISKEDIEKAAIDDAIATFISDKCDGDVLKLKDPEIKAQLEQISAEKLRSMAETQDEKNSYEDVIELLKGKTNSQESGSESTNNKDMFTIDNNSQTDPDEVGDYPLPLVTAKYVDNNVICTFEIPNGYDDFQIETCKKTKSSSNEIYVSNMDKIILNDIDEIACARLVKNGKHGQALVIKFPADAMKVAKIIEENVDNEGKKEEKRRSNAENNNMDKIALNVFDSVQKFDADSTAEDILGNEQVRALENPDTEMYMKESAIRGATNRVLNVADMIRAKKVRMNNEADKNKVLSMLDSAFDESDDLMGMRLFYDETDEFEEYKNSVDTLVNKLLQMKMIDDDNDKLEIKTVPEKNKAFKKLKKQIQDGIENIDINQIIEQWKGAN